MTASTTQADLVPAYGLEIASARAGDDVVVRLDGELELATAAGARDALRRALAGDCDRIVLDLRRVGFLDSTGIHMLVQLHERCTVGGRRLDLLIDRGPVRRTLELCGVLAIFEGAGQEAVAA